VTSLDTFDVLCAVCGKLLSYAGLLLVSDPGQPRKPTRQVTCPPLPHSIWEGRTWGSKAHRPIPPWKAENASQRPFEVVAPTCAAPRRRAQPMQSTDHTIAVRAVAHSWNLLPND